MYYYRHSLGYACNYVEFWLCVHNFSKGFCLQFLSIIDKSKLIFLLQTPSVCLISYFICKFLFYFYFYFICMFLFYL